MNLAVKAARWGREYGQREAPKCLLESADEAIKQRDETHAERVKGLVAALDQSIRQWEMYVTEISQDDLDNIEREEANVLRQCKVVLARYKEGWSDSHRFAN